MFPEDVFKERRDLAEKIANLSIDYVRPNMTSLLRIIWELSASLVLEMQVIQSVKKLDVTDPVAVHKFVDTFADYVRQGDYNLQRTSCGAIAEAFRVNTKTAGVEQDKGVQAVEAIVNGFARADDKLTEDITPIMTNARDELEEIRSLVVRGEVDQARRRQLDFAKKYEAELDKLKEALRSLSDAGTLLVNKVLGVG